MHWLLKRTIYLLLLINFLPLCAYGQRTRWAWIGGASTTNPLPRTSIVWGYKGIPNKSNWPSNRANSCSFFDETAREFWLFGGYDSASGNANDLWRYRLNDSTWTWMAGSQNVDALGVYVSIGFFNASTTPGARSESACAWDPVNREFWLFGGRGRTNLTTASYLGLAMNDLWMYSVVTQQWTWMAGSTDYDQPDDWGTKLIAAPSNSPGARAGALAWIDPVQREFWLFGGCFSADCEWFGAVSNALWRFNISSRSWTWISGSNMTNSPTQEPTGLTQGQTSSAVVPMSRACGTAWFDPVDRILWMHGGFRQNILLGDLFKFNLTSQMWTFVSGTAMVANTVSLGTKGVASPTNLAASRAFHASWIDVANRELWMAGGRITTGLSGYASNDVWKFRLNDSMWVWIDGANGYWNALGVYGTKSIGSTSNMPGGRSNFYVWYDSAYRQVWWFGGQGWGSKYYAPPLTFITDLWVRKDFVDCSQYTSQTLGSSCAGMVDGDTVTVNFTLAVLSTDYSTSQCSVSQFPPTNISSCGSTECLLPGACPLLGLKRDFNTTELLCYVDSSKGSCPGELLCDPSGTCRLPGGRPCSANSNCISGTCASNGICCSSTCHTGGACDVSGACRSRYGQPCAQQSDCIEGLCSEAGFCCAYNCSTGYSCVGTSPCLKVNGETCSARSDCLSSFCTSNQHCCGLQCGAGEGCGPDNSSCYLLDGQNCDRDTACLSGHCGTNGMCCKEAGCACNIDGVCKKPPGGLCDSDDDCQQGICSDLGQCCSTQCVGECVTCATGTCLPLSDGPMQACAEVDCSPYVAGWRGDSGLTCSRFDGILPGYCQAGACSLSPNRCLLEANVTDLSRPSCGSAECKRNCTLLASALLFGAVPSICFVSQESCGIGLGCSSDGKCLASQLVVDNAPYAAVASASPGSIAGGVVGVLVAVLASIAALVFWIRRRRSLFEDLNLTDDMKACFNIKPSELELLHKLGEGSFGVVYFGKYNNKHVAVKLLAVNAFASAVGDFFREAMLVLSVEKHLNVVQVYGMCQERSNLSLVMEFLPNGSLEALTRDAETELSEAEQWKLAHGIASGMSSLARQNIVHRDLAARNILLGEGNVPKIADFGFARVVGEEGEGKTASNVGPVRWMAPEAIKEKKYSEATDVWAYACILLEILTHKEPFAGRELLDVAVYVRDTNGHAAIPPTAPQWMSDLMNDCWEQNPEDRPNFSRIVEYLEKHKPASVVETNSNRARSESKRQQAKVLLTTTDKEKLSVVEDNNKKPPKRTEPEKPPAQTDYGAISEVFKPRDATKKKKNKEKVDESKDNSTSSSSESPRKTNYGPISEALKTKRKTAREDTDSDESDTLSKSPIQTNHVSLSTEIEPDTNETEKSKPKAKTESSTSLSSESKKSQVSDSSEDAEEDDEARSSAEDSDSS